MNKGMTNRIIKFRVWVRNEYMIYSGKDKELDYLEFCEDGTVLIGEGDGDQRYENIPLMQFTGLLDKNGKEIFEGDIIKFGSYYGNYGYVIYDKKEYKYFPIYTSPDDKEDFGKDYPLICNNFEYSEIIGNIYENPNLLIPSKG